jgi:hypothetical protein
MEELGGEGAELSASLPGRNLRRGKDPGYPLFRKLGGTRTNLGAEARGRILCLCRESNPVHPLCSQTLY